MSTMTAPIDPLGLAQQSLGCSPGSRCENGRIETFCQTHPGSEWPCREASDLADSIESRDAQLVRWYRDRESYFADLFGVTDAGMYRADWDAAVSRWQDAQQRQALRQAARECPDRDVAGWLEARAGRPTIRGAA